MVEWDIQELFGFVDGFPHPSYFVNQSYLLGLPTRPHSALSDFFNLFID